MAAGIVALMLQVEPYLTPEEMKVALFASAIKDFYTGTLPAAGTDNWGHGKINAYGAIKKVMEDVPVVYQETASCNLYPNPNKGSFTLVASNFAGAKANVLLLDQVGRTTWRGEGIFDNGGKMPINTSIITPGTYVLEVITNKGIIKNNKVIIY
jgi:hypothetical protein